uniref:Uncharacterized protein n=1 Tax=Anguilla anguilla TaxID=7936 RepID=A0A0E9PVK4_ANGAN
MASLTFIGTTLESVIAICQHEDQRQSKA